MDLLPAKVLPPECELCEDWASDTVVIGGRSLTHVDPQSAEAKASTARAELPGAVPVSAPKNMVRVPEGDFLMGSRDFYPEERPVHRRSVRELWVERSPVTNAEFRRLHKDPGRPTPAGPAANAAEYPDASACWLVPGSLVFTPPEPPGPLKACRV